MQTLLIFVMLLSCVETESRMIACPFFLCFSYEGLHESSITSCKFTPGDDKVITTSTDRTSKFFDLNNAMAVSRLLGYYEFVKMLDQNRLKLHSHHDCKLHRHLVQACGMGQLENRGLVVELCILGS